MPSLATLAAFAFSSLVVLAIPGPTMLYVVARTLEQGRTAGLVSAAGVGLGTLVHVVLAVAGVSAALAACPPAMDAVRVAGAGYLLWLGIDRLRRRPAVTASSGAASTRQLLWQGVLMDALNPKTAIFFLAFLPQFVDAGHGSAAAQVAVLGVLFVVLASICDTTCALLAARARRTMSTTRMDRPAGAALLGLGVVALLG